MGRFITPTDVVITSPLESNGAVPVNVQDQHSHALDLRFIKQLQTPTTTTGALSPEDTTVDVTTTTGFVDGVVVVITDAASGQFYIGEQVGSITGSTVTLDTPIDKAFASGVSIFPANQHMNVDGSGTTQIFQIGPVGGSTAIELDMTRFMGYIQSASAMDDATFGGLSALTYGIVLRSNNTTITNYWNAKSNGELSLICFDAVESSKAPAGSYGFRFRNTYAGQNKHGVTIRLDPGDTLELLIQDALQTLEDFQMMAQGHYVTD